MKDEQLDDLKQFIETTVGQTEQRLRNEMADGFASATKEMTDGFTEVRQEMADGFAGVGEAIEEIHKDIEVRDVQIDTRLSTLEQV